MVEHASFRTGAVLGSIMLLAVILLAGCTPNKAWRPESKCSSPGCDHSYLVEHENYDLAFVEFTERGNVFDRFHKKTIVDHVATLAKSESGVTVIMFVHGWKHNAKVDDNNVKDFRDLLGAAAGVLPSRRRMVGIYVGWRGLSVTAPGIRQLSYWERKTAAEQSGKGGATELFLELEHAVTVSDNPNKNLFVVIGHSFGGAIVLSALNEILLERVVTARTVDACRFRNTDCTCVETRPFGHGVLLLNPAIEANEALQLKEAVGERCFGPNQVRLMHVISSDADMATNKAFRVGQWLGMLKWRETDLERMLNDERAVFHENELDTITVGNYLPFQTGQLCSGRFPEDAQRPECRANARSANCFQRSKKGDWDYISYVGRPDCVPAEDKQQHIPVEPNEPLAFIQTDEAFMADHNDVFSANVAAYLAAIVTEAQFKRARSIGRRLQLNSAGCVNGINFDFGGCFDSFQEVFKGGLAPPY